MKDYFKYVVQLKDDFTKYDPVEAYNIAEIIISVNRDVFEAFVKSPEIRNLMVQTAHALDFLENSNLKIKHHEYFALPSFLQSKEEIDAKYILTIYTKDKETFVFTNIDIVPDLNVKVKWEYDEFFNKYLDNKLDKEFLNETL